MGEAADLRGRGRGVLAAFTPHPHRGDLIAAGAAPLVIGVLLVNLRFDDVWGTGVFLVLTGAACALVLGMGMLAPLQGERPRPYQQVLLLVGLALLLVALLRLAQVLGVEHPLGPAGTRTWVFGVLTGVAAWLARARRSAVCALVAALAGIVLATAFVDWVFAPHGPATFRWVLLALAIGFVLEALARRETHRRESVYLVDAAGIAILAIALTYIGALLSVVTLLGAPAGVPGAGWKLVLLAAGLGLVAYAAVDGEPGPAYIGTLNLLLWIGLVGLPVAGASLWFWPLALVLLGVAAIAAGLRPRRPLPPEPARGSVPAEPTPGPGHDRDASRPLWSEPAGGEQPPG